MLSRWCSTVFAGRNKAAAISALPWPSAASPDFALGARLGQPGHCRAQKALEAPDLGAPMALAGWTCRLGGWLYQVPPPTVLGLCRGRSLAASHRSRRATAKGRAGRAAENWSSRKGPAARIVTVAPFFLR